VAGYPLNNGKSYLDLDGKIFDIAPYKDKYGTLPRAYYFNNLNTSSGMSGGPLVNQQGNIVGILIGEQTDSGTGAKTASVVMPINLYPQWQAIRNSQKLSSPLPSPNQTLEQLLAAKKWGAANDKTWEILLKEGDVDKSDDLDSNELLSLNCKTLADLDLAWRKASNGRYGFRLQRSIYNKYHYTLPPRESRLYLYTEFAKELGWFNDIQQVSTLSISSLYNQKNPNLGFYPIWFVYRGQLGQYPFGLPSDDNLLRDPGSIWESRGTILSDMLKRCSI
jgi:hypothetical protein